MMRLPRELTFLKDPLIRRAALFCKCACTVLHCTGDASRSSSFLPDLPPPGPDTLNSGDCVGVFCSFHDHACMDYRGDMFVSVTNRAPSLIRLGSLIKFIFYTFVIFVRRVRLYVFIPYLRTRSFRPIMRDFHARLVSLAEAPSIAGSKRDSRTMS